MRCRAGAVANAGAWYGPGSAKRHEECHIAPGTRAGEPMNLAPLLDAVPPIPLHALAAIAAFVLGIVQFAAPKGTLPHRSLGWIWVGLMAAVALSSLGIHQIR